MWDIAKNFSLKIGVLVIIPLLHRGSPQKASTAR